MATTKKTAAKKAVKKVVAKKAVKKTVAKKAVAAKKPTKPKAPVKPRAKVLENIPVPFSEIDFKKVDGPVNDIGVIAKEVSLSADPEYAEFLPDKIVEPEVALFTKAGDEVTAVEDNGVHTVFNEKDWETRVRAEQSAIGRFFAWLRR